MPLALPPNPTQEQTDLIIDRYTAQILTAAQLNVSGSGWYIVLTEFENFTKHTVTQDSLFKTHSGF